MGKETKENLITWQLNNTFLVLYRAMLDQIWSMPRQYSVLAKGEHQMLLYKELETP